MKYWLAKQTGISANAIGKIVNSKTGSIGFEVPGKICQALECNVGDIIVYEKEVKKSPV
ncbi:MAG: helix-turn-helix transcriptional regulator [Clostridiaceae bacterium]|nr:helix-turn-helix transcriptional regulator [Clostridiaceae bacterium]